jgi:hypothetical protein
MISIDPYYAETEGLTYNNYWIASLHPSDKKVTKKPPRLPAETTPP